MSEEKNPLADLISGLSKTIKEQDEGELLIDNDIKFPIEVADLKVSSLACVEGLHKVGSWCAVRWVQTSETYLGIFLGDLPNELFSTYRVSTKELRIVPHRNPAIFVPDLKRIVWGCESWWGVLKRPEDLRKITNQDIENVWYVKALKELVTAEEKKE